MKGIRERAMSSPDDDDIIPINPTYPYGSTDRYDGIYDAPGGYETAESYAKKYKPYLTPTENGIEITITIKSKDIGNIADYDHKDYDEEKAQTQAIILAYTRLETLLEPTFETKYKIDSEVLSLSEDYEVKFVLEPSEKEK